jgi:hypothetical protein
MEDDKLFTRNIVDCAFIGYDIGSGVGRWACDLANIKGKNETVIVAVCGCAGAVVGILFVVGKKRIEQYFNNLNENDRQNVNEEDRQDVNEEDRQDVNENDRQAGD